MKKTAIIGSGKLGTTIGYSLAKQGFSILALTCRTLSSAKESAEIIGEGTPMTDNKKAVENAEMVIISVPDDKIKDVVKELSGLDLNKKFIFHCSGILSSQILGPLKESGAQTASIHPVRSFPKKSREFRLFKNVYFSIEGAKKEQELSQMIVRKLGGLSFILKPKDKPLYHAACTIASNYLIVLIELARSVLEKADIKQELRDEIILSLIKETLRNAEKTGISQSLTGPVSRGDLETLKSHLISLRPYPSVFKTYQDFAKQALKIAKKENRLSQNKIKKIKALLE